jgi:hypothetical protein
MNWWDKSSDDPLLNFMVGIGFIIYAFILSLYNPLYLITYTLLAITYYLI